MTRRNRIVRGAKKTIWRMELMATKMAQYSLSPPANPVHIKTCNVSTSGFPIGTNRFNYEEDFTIAMHLAKPTRIKPSRRPSFSGKNAQESPSYRKPPLTNHLVSIQGIDMSQSRKTAGELTMRKGETIQLTTTLKTICHHISLD